MKFNISTGYSCHQLVQCYANKKPGLLVGPT